MTGSSFHFELAPVLQLREQAVENAQEALAQSIQHRQEWESNVRTATAALDAALDTTSAAPRTIHQLGGAAAHRQVLAQTLSEAVRGLELSQAEEANARRQLGQAMRECEALMALRTEASDLHRVQALRTETARLDDLVTGRRPAKPSAAPPQV